MKLLFDPVWPWQPLHAFLGTAEAPVRAAAVSVGLLAFAVPILLLRLPGKLDWKRWAVLLGTSGWLLVHVERAAWKARTSAHGLQPAWLLLLMVGLLALAGLSIATYLGAPGVPRRRIGAIVSLRLLALLLTLIAVVRPALGFVNSEQPRSLLLVAIDFSRSMTIEDETGAERSRWALVQRCLEQSKPALQGLRDDQVEVRFFKFAGDVADFDADKPGEADGKHTDYGAMLRALLDRRSGRDRLRGLLVIGDGTDNGRGVPALTEAARWRNLPCPISTFACGRPTTSLKQKNVAITAISTRPSPFVPVKGKLTARVTIDARGYENSKAKLRMFLETPVTRDGKTEMEDVEKAVKDVELRLAIGNVVDIACDAPATPGEVKVKVVVETPEPDTLPADNVIETFVTVSKDGISVLLVDRLRAWEPTEIIGALSSDPRIRVTPVYLGGKATPALAKAFQVEEQPYDVIVIGDVSAAQIRQIDKDALVKLEGLVARGSGLIMVGGYASFGSAAWGGTGIEGMLPVELTRGEEGEGAQVEDEVTVVPTFDGLRLATYLLRLDDGKDAKEVWKALPLNGMSLLKLPPVGRRTNETVLASSEKGQPVLVMKTYEGFAGRPKGAKPARVLAFAGDTTWRWRRNEAGVRRHARFWKQVVVWLAHQEDAEGNTWVKPESRRLPVRGEISFEVGLRAKGGGPDVKGGTYRAEIVRPDGTKTVVPIARGSTENRGAFGRTDAPGTYVVRVQGEGKGPGGEAISGTATARVIVYDEDQEMKRAAADHQFLENLAAAGGGKYQRVEQLAAFLSQLRQQQSDWDRARLDLRPDWRNTSRSPFLVAFFLLFVAAVSAEWALRRRWGLV